MKTSSIPLAVLSLMFVPFLVAQHAQETALQPTPSTEKTDAGAGDKLITSQVAMPSDEILEIAGFPRVALQFEPALAAALQLTPEQQQALKSAKEESLDQVKTDMAGNDDKRQVYRAQLRAQSDFISRRDSILRDQQISLMKTIQTALGTAQTMAKNAKIETGKKGDTKEIFFKELKPTLTAEQLALIEAAGGKVP